ncbi:DNA polymerase alpha catalytic subunit isoform X2 [Rhodnius prolixus]|uniref:DNA polymerase alpha catalytic subunit isoform X2 n=1 Tax=Rhodnius prolixus TaxID=13249 RepID=UPI003D18B0D6
MDTEEIPETPQGRPKRCSSAKQKKLEILERMRNTRKSGKKNKYDIGELENVYEEVDEKEYTKTVLSRQEDDWIVDDGGNGYIEDGREIFDDDLDEESIEKSKTVITGKKRSRDLGPISKKGNIRNMLAGMPAKKRKESAIKLEEDDILGDLICELDVNVTSNNRSQNPNSTVIKPARKITNEPTKVIKVDNEEWDKACRPTIPKAQPKPVPVILLNKEIKQETIDVDNMDNISVSPKANHVDVEKLVSQPLITKIKEEKVDDYEEWDNDCDIDFTDDYEVDTKQENNIAKPEIPQIALIKEENLERNDGNINWDESFEVTDNGPNSVNIDRSKLPLLKKENGEEVLRFYYWDANEEMYTQPGTVFLFGKLWVPSVETYVSCCVIVKNIDRQIYLLPKERKENGEDVTMSDVYEEFNSKITQKYKIKQFKSRKSVKKYAFGKEDIPIESEYLEVKYPANCQPLPVNLTGETFSHVFGTRTSFLELLLLQRSIKGPGWIEISHPEPSITSVSWCKVEVMCNKPSYVTYVKDNSALSIPPLVLATLLPQMVFNPKSRQSEVVAVACLVNHTYSVDQPTPERLFNQHFCVLSRPSDIPWPYDLNGALQNFKKTNVHKMDSERALLNYLLTKLYKIDADIIVGHDLSGYTIELLVSRLSLHKVPNWSRLSRLKRSVIPSSKGRGQIEKIALTGRLLCDVKISAKELIRSRSYDLDTLCQNVLHFKEGKRTELSDEEFRYAFCNGGTLTDAVWHLMSDASYILRIFFELNIFPLALQITNIAGNVISRTLMGGRSERNEFLLLHAFHSKDYILPDKEFKKNVAKEELDLGEGVNVETLNGKSSRKKPSYAGGLVLDPKVGFYDDLILLMDFNSLYPSIIQEYNICFTTIPVYQITMEDSFTDTYNKHFPNENVDQGILPTEIRKLVESRKGVKEILKKDSTLTPEQKAQYDIRQMALKLTANSMYGCLGFAHSRFYAKPLAALVTAKGREILLNTKKMVESYGYDVIYGDTDSIMINTKTKQYDQVYQIGRKIKAEVNKCYKQVELDIDGVFKYMLLLKKKKYAAVSIIKLPNGELFEKREMKGLDIVRRDWSQISAEAGKFVLKQILSDQSRDDRVESIHGYLENIRQDLEAGKVPLTLLTVTKQLTKPPEEYVDSKALPHVQVALRINKSSSKKFKQGDTVSYVICQDGTNNPATQRAYHIDELKSNDNLSVDLEYYLSQQIHPVIARLCDPIEGTDAATIARCLGLDPTKYKRQVQDSGDVDEDENIFGKKDEEKFKDCEKFSFTCKREGCNTENIIDHPLRKLDNGVELLFLEHCTNRECTLRPIEYMPMIQNKLHLKVRAHIQKYSEGWLRCEDATCDYRTNVINPKFEKAYPICQKCGQGSMRREECNEFVGCYRSHLQCTNILVQTTPHYCVLRIKNGTNFLLYW